MDSSQISLLLRPYAELTASQLERTSRYLDLLLKWNARINLTSVRKPDEIVARHFGESYFAAARVLEPAVSCEVVDVGSGAGFPGLPLAIFCPQAHVVLIEADTRKATFLNEVIGALELKNAQVFNRRAEAYEQTADLVTLRAVEKFQKSLPIAVELVRSGGRIALMVGSSQKEHATRIASEVSWSEVVPIPQSNSRVLAVGTRMVKVG